MRFIRSYFSIDYRSLILYRTLLGGLLVLYAAERLRGVEAFYSDNGVLPREYLWLSKSHLPSLFMLSGSVWWATALLTVLLGLGLLLMARFGEQFVSLLAFILVLSVRNRNSAVTSGADDVIAMLTLWSIFLPTTRGGETRAEFCSLVSILATLQIALFYICVGWLKDIDAWFWQPNAAYYALSIPSYAVPLGQKMLHFPVVLQVATVLTFLWERFAWLLLFSPIFFSRFRTAACFGYMLMHIGFGFFLELGLFPAADVTLIVLLLPRNFWDFVLRTREVKIDTAQSLQLRSLKWLINGTASVIFALILWNNVNSLYAYWRIPKPIYRLSQIIGAQQRWDMFAPAPRFNDGWVVVEGKTASGKSVDPVNKKDRVVARERPKDEAARWPQALWSALISRLRENGPLKARFPDFLCEQWNRTHTDPLEVVSIDYYSHASRPIGEAPEVKSIHWIVQKCE